ncbi:MAG: hypothetical protein A2Z34_02270 [Planctomycetes bacterium RBG_16_59_8]|nr:MAG: hypothetical protein A2Z34_02270 [Planctomycetes bacterium RBG_16_59_8]
MSPQRMGAPAESGAQRFPTTNWSMMLFLKDPGNPAFATLLNRLVEQYWRPAYHYIRAMRNLSIEEAEDLTQQFFTMLLSRRDLEKLSPERGSFRGFLKTALRNFLISNDRSQLSRAPKEGARIVSFDAAENDWKDLSTRMPEIAPEEAFDREWAREILAEAVEKLEQTLATEEKSSAFDIFREYCFDASLVRPSYGDLARRYRITEDDVRNALRHARDVIREILKDILSEYAAPGEAIEDEVRFILAR